jgi:TonB family protein
MTGEPKEGAMSGSYDDAQRVLERKALENVRSLVDKVEAEDRNRTDEAVTFTGKVLVVVLVVLALAVSLATPIRGLMRSSDPIKPTRHMSAAEYVEHCLSLIERRVNMNALSRSEMDGPDGSVGLTLVIRRDGYIKDIEVTKSSWNSRFDGTVTRIVKIAQSFGPLPDAVRKDSDVLRITRTFRVERSGTRSATLIIERASAGEPEPSIRGLDVR